MRFRTWVWGAIGVALLFANMVVAQSFSFSPAEEGPIVIDADEMEYFQRDAVVGAEGNVVVTHGTTQLLADKLSYSQGKRIATASGRVRLSSDEGELSADSVLLNLNDETGEFHDVELHAKQNRYSLWGKRAEKGIGQTYRIEGGRFTTCRCNDEAPSWSISGERLDIALGGWADLWGGKFNVLDVPILYIPRAFFPVEVERQSGFLMPRFGASSRRGFQTLLPFYLVLNKSQDATVAFDAETSARVGFLAEYRYVVAQGSGGSVSGAYFNEAIRGTTQGSTPGSTIPQSRWNVIADQHQSLPAGVEAYSNVFLVGDDLFLREINTYTLEHQKAVATRTLPFTDSHVGLLRSWERVAAKLDATFYQNLAQEPGVTESQTLQRLPEARVWGQKKVGDFAQVSLDSSAVSFQRSGGSDGFRLDVSPGVQVPLPIGPYAFGSLNVTGRETTYRLLDNELSDGSTLARNKSRETLRAGAIIESSLARVFAAPWASDVKLKHLVEPFLAYTFVPGVGQSELPLFDGVDRVNARNQFTYGFVTRLLQKAPGDGNTNALPIRELGRISLSQTVDMSRDITPISCEIGAGQPCASDHFSDVDLAGRLNPASFLSVRFRSNYDTNNTNLTAAQLGFYVEDPRLPALSEEQRRVSTATSAGISYRFLAPNRLQQLDGNLIVELTDWAGFLYASRYDVVQNRFLDNFYGLRFLSQCDCWSLDVTVTDRTNPRELEVRAQVTLVGLGSSATERRSAFLP